MALIYENKYTGQLPFFQCSGFQQRRKVYSNTQSLTQNGLLSFCQACSNYALRRKVGQKQTKNTCCHTSANSRQIIVTCLMEDLIFSLQLGYKIRKAGLSLTYG